MHKDNELCLMLLLFLLPGTSLRILRCAQRDKHLTSYESSVHAENTVGDFIQDLTSVTTQTAEVSDFRIEIKLCENGSLPVHSACKCRWISGEGPVCKNLINDSMCEADNSTMRFSLLIKSGYSEVLWIFYKQNATPFVLKHTILQVTYPAQITALHVNEQEVKETYLVGENEEVNVSCFFTNGNPPVNVSLHSDIGKNLTRLNKGSLTLFLGAYHCHDLWPTIRCEAPGSELNRSVDILVKCRPQLSYITTQVTDVHNILSEGLIFAMKSHTSDIRKCLMAQVQPRTSPKEVKCEVSGHAPEFNLTLRSFDTFWIGAGIWTLHVTSESGDSSITFQLISITGKSRRLRITQTSKDSDFRIESCGKMVGVDGSLVTIMVEKLI